ncbi:hypothetical protein HN51_045984, partial [Arachis hypogaea]
RSKKKEGVALVFSSNGISRSGWGREFKHREGLGIGFPTGWDLSASDQSFFPSLDDMGARGVVGDKWSMRILWACALGSAAAFLHQFLHCRFHNAYVIGVVSACAAQPLNQNFCPPSDTPSLANSSPCSTPTAIPFACAFTVSFHCHSYHRAHLTVDFSDPIIFLIRSCLYMVAVDRQKKNREKILAEALNMELGENTGKDA